MSLLRSRSALSRLLLLCLALLGTKALLAQDGKLAITQANDMLRVYFKDSVTLTYSIAAICGLIGAVRVYSSFNDGRHDEAKSRATAWFFGCLFLVIAATVVKLFFGI